MSSENETVVEILKQLREYTNQLHINAFNNATEDSLRVTLHSVLLDVEDYAREIEKAHKHEITTLYALTDEAMADVANEKNKCVGCFHRAEAERLVQEVNNLKSRIMQLAFDGNDHI